VSTLWAEVQNDIIKQGGDFYFKQWVPTVFEGIELQGDYNKFPVKGPSVFMTNSDEARVFDDNMTSFDFSLRVENISNDLGNDAFLNAGDITYRREVVIDEEVVEIGQEFFLYGTPIISSTDYEYQIEDKENIRQSGRRYLEVNIPWVQGGSAAKKLANTINTYMGQTMDVIEVEWVPNPALEVGDIVTVDYSDRGYTTSTHKYYVIGKNTSFDDGLSGSLTLLRWR
jgi:hypothetical protein